MDFVRSSLHYVITVERIIGGRGFCSLIRIQNHMRWSSWVVVILRRGIKTVKLWVGKRIGTLDHGIGYQLSGSSSLSAMRCWLWLGWWGPRLVGLLLFRITSSRSPEIYPASIYPIRMLHSSNYQCDGLHVSLSLNLNNASASIDPPNYLSSNTPYGRLAC